MNPTKGDRVTGTYHPGAYPAFTYTGTVTNIHYPLGSATQGDSRGPEYTIDLDTPHICPETGFRRDGILVSPGTRTHPAPLELAR
jgi:hypothetical protein